MNRVDMHKKDMKKDSYPYQPSDLQGGIGEFLQRYPFKGRMVATFNSPPRGIQNREEMKFAHDILRKYFKGIHKYFSKLRLGKLTLLVAGIMTADYKNHIHADLLMLDVFGKTFPGFMEEVLRRRWIAVVGTRVSIDYVYDLERVTEYIAKPDHVENSKFWDWFIYGSNKEFLRVQREYAQQGIQYRGSRGHIWSVDDVMRYYGISVE